MAFNSSFGSHCYILLKAVSCEAQINQDTEDMKATTGLPDLLCFFGHLPVESRVCPFLPDGRLTVVTCREFHMAIFL